jgi:hypothetical protein
VPVEDNATAGVSAQRERTTEHAFDRLAKRLANGKVSRRQVLMGLAASAVVGCFPMLGGRNASAQGLADCPRDPNRRNNVDGSCDELEPTRVRGVIDADGTPHPGHWGWTLPNFSIRSEASPTLQRMGGSGVQLLLQRSFLLQTPKFA